MKLRDAEPEDAPALDALYRAAFPEEDLRPLVRALLTDPAAPVAIVAVDAADLVGHIAFSLCAVAGHPTPVALLGPLAVAPRVQRQGLGGRLVNAGLTRLEALGVSHAFVLGDPAYYRRFDFEPDAAVAPPYPLPDAWRDAWRSKPLDQGSAAPRGTLEVPQVWRREEYWGG